MDIMDIARVAHEINRAYCESLGDSSQPTWDDAPEWQRSSAINGVSFHINNPSAGPDHSHNCWLEEKVANGWKYGPIKDAEFREHPCMVPYENLPQEQKAKDFIFRGTVHALSKFLTRDKHLPTQPPIDNAHVAPGCEPFSADVVAANEAAPVA